MLAWFDGSPDCYWWLARCVIAWFLITLLLSHISDLRSQSAAKPVRRIQSHPMAMATFIPNSPNRISVGPT